MASAAGVQTFHVSSGIHPDIVGDYCAKQAINLVRLALLGAVEDNDAETGIEANFWQLYRPLADNWTLLYNSGEQLVDVASGSPNGEWVREEGSYFPYFNIW